MQKKYILPHLVVSALMLLPLAGCKGHSDEPTDGYRSAIQLQVTPRTLATGARAITDGQDPEVPGIAPEDEIIDGQLFIGEDFGLTASRSFTRKGDNKWSAKFEEKLEDPTSSHRIAAVINSSRLGLRGSDYTSESTVSLADIDRMIGKSFLMSSTFDNKDNNFYTLDEDKCTDVTLDVERVVSKVQLHRAKEMTGEEMKETYGLLQPDKMTWTIAGSAKSAYLFTDHAGSLHLGDDGLYKDLKTVSAEGKGKGGYDLMKLSDKGLSKSFDARPVSLFESGKVKNNDGGLSTDDRIYFLEHALNETEAGTPYDKSVTYKDVTYVKIYTGLTSIKGFRIDNDKVNFSRHKVFKTKDEALDGFAESQPATTSPELLDQQLLKDIDASEPTADRWYWVDVTDTKWFKDLSEEDKKNQTIKEDKDYYTTDSEAATRSFLLVHDQPTTFYYGIDDHTIYDTLLAARAGGNSKIRKYEGGKMVYLSPLNEQRTTEKGPVFNCDTRRNNIYDLILNSITGLGLNYDPVDPDDPNIPEPGDNPWEPEPNIPPINGRENVIRITATPLQWNTMDHTLELM
ncbi:fimbria major subunit [Porphyromonas bennonis]|uniref:fimbria major subunit n=1 Tax=Porphyromonas bennonis TaxID=501496 RepID=UPI000375D1BA|nr:fimbria major subunit [Porphyromonas bennonis]